MLYLTVGVVLGVGATASAHLALQDPVKQSPQLYTVRVDNDRVRVLEYRLKPGEKEPMHSHTPGLVFVLSEATTRTTAADGRVSEGTSKVGTVTWRDAVSHSLENIGTTEAHNYAVEVKPCAR